MSTEPRPHEPAGGDALLFLISAALIAVVAIESVFIAYGGWWFMVGVLALIACAALVVVSSIVRLMDHDTPFARARFAPEPEPEPARPAPAPRPRVVTH